MNIFSSLVLLLLAALPLALAANRLTSIIVSYPDNTPDSIISQDKQDLIDAFPTRGFSAQAPADAKISLSSHSSDYHPNIEDDGIVTAYNAPE
ncbi:hypothetical protein PHISCL_08414 [Aspergillus sclerotialis]|uniref:Uncharacterized protein n=1 Tax=Aspergillus sclerotialis TaxID=2070753 RepID=A0A3A2ZD67_9EURO|nr:hypothetical protein PHISCL_08414 [Aspergillus sclerotialis]